MVAVAGGIEMHPRRVLPFVAVMGLVAAAPLPAIAEAPECTLPSAIIGTAGDDVLRGTSGDDVICGLGGKDQIHGGRGRDLIIGGSDKDQLSGQGGSDELRGDGGNDLLDGGAGNDVIAGGEGEDLVGYATRTAAVTVTLGVGAEDGEAGEGDDILGDVENVATGSGNDVLVGSDGDNVLEGNAGDDVLVGAAGNDTLGGYAGSDVVVGGDGHDAFWCYGGVDVFERLPGDVRSGCEISDPIGVGAGHTCAISAAQQVRCWGNGDSGELGSNSTADLMDQPGEESSVVPLGSNAKAVSVAAGDDHTCAVTDDGLVWCWGRGANGRIGSGATANLMDEPGEVPSRIDLGEPAVSVTAGYGHSCALTQGGSVRCWGLNQYGQLGTGSKTTLMDDAGEAPSTVPLGIRVASLTSSAYGLCAVAVDGTARCWGEGTFGRNGDGTSGSLLDAPGEHASVVTLGSPAVGLGGGDFHACALVPGDIARCWGYGQYGQLGASAVTNLMDNPGEGPSAVGIGSRALDVTAGLYHSCVAAVAAVRCWGHNEFGQLGVGSTQNLMDQPGEQPGTLRLTETMASIEAGYWHTCGVSRVGRVRCWGNGRSGQLGSGGRNNLMDGPAESPSSVTLP